MCHNVSAGQKKPCPLKAVKKHTHALPHYGRRERVLLECETETLKRKPALNDIIGKVFYLRSLDQTIMTWLVMKEGNYDMHSTIGRRVVGGVLMHAEPSFVMWGSFDKQEMTSDVWLVPWMLLSS